MASPNTVFTELVSTTFRKHSKEIKDNVSKNNALLRRIYDKGNVRREDGGLSVRDDRATHSRPALAELGDEVRLPSEPERSASLFGHNAEAYPRP